MKGRHASIALAVLLASMVVKSANAQDLLLGVGHARKAGSGGGGGRATPTIIYSNGQASTPGGAGTLTTTGGCAAGQSAIALLGNNGGQGSFGVTDSKGNTWTFARDSFPAGNLYGSIYKTILTTGLVAGDTISVTFGASVSTATLIFACIGALTADATGGGNDGGSSTAPTAINVSTSSSPPTGAARVFMFLADMGNYSTVTVSDPSGPGWTLGATEVDAGTGDYGFKLYYQDVSAGATSTLRWTPTGTSTVNWGAWWISFD